MWNQFSQGRIDGGVSFPQIRKLMIFLMRSKATVYTDGCCISGTRYWAE